MRFLIGMKHEWVNSGFSCITAPKSKTSTNEPSCFRDARNDELQCLLPSLVPGRVTIIHTTPYITLHYTIYTLDTFTYAKKRWKPSLRKFYFTMPEIVYHLSLVVQTFIYKMVKNQVAFGGAQLEHHQPHESLKCYHLVMPHFVRENLKMFRDGDQAS